jgi:large subunit ribosomal protein L21
MFAIVRTGGKQYRVGVGDQITVERIAGDVGAEIELGDVLAIGGDETPVIGKPTVPDAAVRARIVQQPRGHRQELTVLKIEEIKRGAA